MVKDREYHRNYSRDYYHARKNDLISLMGGKCVKCGSTDNLQFDHINPDEKSFPISKLLNFSKKKIEEEIKKCQLLCKECHKEKSSIDISNKNSGHKSPNSVFSEETVKILREKYYNERFDITEFAKEYKVSTHTLAYMLRGKTYKNTITGYEKSNDTYLREIGNYW